MTYTQETQGEALTRHSGRRIGVTTADMDYRGQNGRYSTTPHEHRWVTYGPDDDDPTCAGCGVPMVPDAEPVRGGEEWRHWESFEL